MVGLIVTRSKKVEHPDFVSVSETIPEDRGLTPTLIVGKKLAIELCGKENVHMLDREIGPNLYWTYTKMEKRSSYERDMEAFMRYIIDEATENIAYKYFSLFTEPLSSIKRLIKSMKSKRVKIVYVRNRMLYIYSGNNKVMGLSISQMEYLGVDTGKLMDRMKAAKWIWVIFGMGDVDEYTRRRLSSVPMAVPYLYAEKKGVFTA